MKYRLKTTSQVFYFINATKNIFFIHPNGLFCMHPTVETAADGLLSPFLLPRILSTLLQPSKEHQHRGLTSCQNQDKQLPCANAEKNN